MSNLKIDKKRKLVGNIFNLCLTITHKIRGNNITTNTSLLVDLFMKPNKSLHNLAIININTDQNVKFNFSNLTIESSYFDNFSTFWDCIFNENSKFVRCQLLNLKSTKGKSNLRSENLIDCTYDSEVEFSLKFLEEKEMNKGDQMKSFLNSFLHLFMSNGKLGRQWEDKVIMPRYAGINKYRVDYKKLIRILKKSEVLKISLELGKNKFEINENYKEEVIKFIKDGTISNSISFIIKELSE